jgi:uridine kinase
MRSEIFSSHDFILGERHILTIDGPAGAGKTTLAEELARKFVQEGFTVEVIHMDDLYNGWHDALGESLTQSLKNIVDGYNSGRIHYVKYNWQRGDFSGPISLNSPDILILEGVGSGQSAIRSHIFASLWIDIEALIALERVIARDGEAIRPYMEQWQLDQASHFQHEQTKGAADYQIDGAP